MPNPTRGRDLRTRLRTAVSRLVTHERHEGATVLVVTSGWPNPDNPAHCVFIKRQMESIAAQGLVYDVLFIRGYRSALAYPLAGLLMALRNFTGGWDYRLVHAHGGEASLSAAMYRRAPLVTSYLGGDLLGNSTRPDGKITPRAALRRWFIRQHARLSARTITKSLEMERALPRSIQSRNTVVPNGVNTSIFRPIPRDAARAELGWDDGRVVLYAANPEELRKRYALSSDAVDRAREQLDDIRLVVAHRLEPDLVPLYMNAADCLVLLSWMEGSPNVVKEALMCDLPVVATPVGDIPELLEPVTPSFIVEPTVEAVAAALVECCATPQRSDGYARSAHLAEDVIAGRVLDLYRELAPDVAAVDVPRVDAVAEAA